MPMIRTYAELGRLPMIGDRVKIVDKKAGGCWDPDGCMKKYLGSIFTVSSVETSWNGAEYFIFLKEWRDYGEHSWCWWPHMIEGVIVDEIDEDPAVWTSDFTIDDLLTS